MSGLDDLENETAEVTGFFEIALFARIDMPDLHAPNRIDILKSICFVPAADSEYVISCDTIFSDHLAAFGLCAWQTS